MNDDQISRHGAYYRRTAVCPYYECQFQNSKWSFIECAGLFDGERRIRHKFRGRRARDRVLEEYCCGDFQECPVARAIYEEKEGGE